MTVLIISHSGDPHYQAVAEKLEERGHSHYLFDFSYKCGKYHVSYELANERGVSILLTDGQSPPLSLREVTSVWNRRPFNIEIYKKNPEYQLNPYHRYASSENLSLIKLFYNVLKDNLWWPNTLSSSIEDKPTQLLLAHQVGLRVPETWIGTNPESLRKFLSQSCGLDRLAVKALNRSCYVTQPSRVILLLVKIANATVKRYSEEKYCVAPYRSVFTQVVGRDLLDKKASLVENCPVQVQKYINKKLELRITVVGKTIFACAIDSQKHDHMKEDWRRFGTLDVMHSVQSDFKLPKEIEKKCLDLMDLLGLNFGCIDMILTPDDEFVFLEVNPNGQWLWLEHSLGYNISGAIADKLIGC